MKVYQIGDINDKNSFLKKLNGHTKGVDLCQTKWSFSIFILKEFNRRSRLINYYLKPRIGP